MANIFDLFKQIQTAPTQSAVPLTHMIVGLGNPGVNYTFNRHNAGFMAMDFFTQKNNTKADRARFKALTCEFVISEKRVLLMKPQTFMNSSGESVREAADFYKIPSDNIIVIQDDIALEPGRLRIRRKGSDGGHNGIKSIIEHLGTDSFTRIKLGVGSPPSKDEIINWVLGDIPHDNREAFFKCVENSYAATELILRDDTERAMNLYNT